VTQPTPLTATLAVIDEVITRWPDLVESRVKGTERPVPSGRRDSDEVDEGEGFGCVPAPIHLDVLDAMASIVMWADMLHEHVAQTIGHPRLEPAASALADPRPFLAYVRELLPEAAESDDEIVDAARDKAERMKSVILAKVGEVFDGQTLEALCPFCVGQTFGKRHIRSLRVRIIPSRVKVGEEEFVIVCENPDGCRPFAAECDMWVRGRPAWPWSQWDWLAERLIPTRGAA
jgi:hypothetical protein